jgi:membrane protease YdiL (CAAX protease family)
MRALALLLLIPIAMWLSQTLLLRRAGLPVRLRIGAPDLPDTLKRVNRITTNLLFAATLLGYPLIRGQSPLDYYAAFLPADGRAWDMLYGVAAAVLYLALLYLAWTATDLVRFEVRHSAARLLRRLATVPFTAVFIAFVEELLFRAMLLAELWESLDDGVAMTVGVLVFALAHYVRSVKRYWTFPGHLALGLLFCTAFYATRNLWLVMGLHAGGVLVLMGVRPFVRYVGPAWLCGASIFPYAGIVGVAALLLLTVNIWLSYGVS